MRLAVTAGESTYLNRISSNGNTANGSTGWVNASDACDQEVRFPQVKVVRQVESCHGWACIYLAFARDNLADFGIFVAQNGRKEG